MNSHAIKTGIILGVINIVLTLLIYIINPTSLAEWWFGLIMLAVALFLVSYLGIQHRNEIGGFMPFGQGWIYSIQAFVISGLIGTLFNILLYNIIDPELPAIVADQVVENSESMMRNFGMPEDQMDDALDKAREDTLERFTLTGSLTGFLWGLVISAILALITGAIIKKKEPELEV